jgi:hypothetical protein
MGRSIIPHLLTSLGVEGREICLFGRVDQKHDVAFRIDRRCRHALNAAKGPQRYAPTFLAIQIVRQESNIGEENEDGAAIGGRGWRGGTVYRVGDFGQRFGDGLAP